MKVRIKDLEPNPFRDMKNYPINPEKIESLAKSINQTGFWDNILARRKNGKIQIAYGHHRLVALQRTFKPDHIVDIPIKNLDDSTMIRIMANENDESWEITPGIINETVRITFEYLRADHPILREEMVKRPQGGGVKVPYFEGLPLPKTGEQKWSVIAWQISNWLGGNWNEKRVYYSLDHLKRMNEIEIEGEEIEPEEKLDKEAIESMPRDTYARRFATAAKRYKLTPEQQKKAAQRIVEQEDFSEEGIEYEALEEKIGPREEKEEKEKEFVTFIEECSKLINTLNRKFDVLIDFKSDFDSKYYKNTFARFEFDGLINALQIKLKKLMENKQ